MSNPESKDNYQDLTSQEAVAKLKELAEDIKTCMFCTELSSRPVPTRPMSLQEVDGQGNLWFISSARSNKNFEIKQDNDVQLMFAKNQDAQFLSIYGQATIYRDRQHIDEVWSPIAKAWFDEGKDDPNVTVIKVTPTDAYYWDTKYGKMISFLKWAKGAITGNLKDDGGIEGRLNV
ncbi:general stress protein [Flavobacterium cyanobacteriorum]|uniref:General stress protein n=1 Tax=Flavobacterium cyanobacteriorum TaxID=2022802 RepID=A0A255Z6E7_9FLAO|nr:pyridoxamine 5'-phosphate oxidase family protein [Flavobacterium cyanobacteriorum]OYQ37002.1 general stress protein [Flavobacterium cyanobacteriorum]